MMQRYLVIYQNGSSHLSAYVPDVPGCASIGHSMEELRENIHDELEFHLERITLNGRRVPGPIMGMDDIDSETHAEWMVVRPLPEKKTVSLNAKIRQWLHRVMVFRLNWISRDLGSDRRRADLV